MPQSRQLAAIMFTDIVGYTALMGSDDKKAFALLNKNRQLQKPIIESLGGKWIKEMGDGVIASFNTASDALAAAKKIQEACHADADFQLRIGIHLGEVVFENDDVFGDGVNIASRIESLGIAGSVLISKAVRDQVKNNSDFQLDSLGSFDFKNVVEPMEVFALTNPGFAVPRREAMQGKLKLPHKKSNAPKWIILVASIVAASFAVWFLTGQRKASEPTGEQSIAVLAFVDMSQGKDQEYFSDGLSENTLDLLAKVPGLKVIGRTSSFSFKGKNEDLRVIGEKLGAANILEGSVQRDGNTVRITAQLIRAADGIHLWSGKFDRELKDIFAIQDEIALAILKAIKLELVGEEKETVLKKYTENVEAYQLFLKARYHFNKLSPADFFKAIEYYQSAIDIDPNYAIAYAEMGSCYWDLAYFNWAPGAQSIPKALSAINQALLIDAQNDICQIAKGRILIWYEWDFIEAAKYLNKGIQINPNNVEGLRQLGLLNMLLGNYEDSHKLYEKAENLDPFSLLGLTYAGGQQWFGGFFDREIDYGKKLIALEPYFFGGHLLLGLGYYGLNRYDEAVDELEAAAKLNPDMQNLAVLGAVYAYKGELRKAEEVLAKMKAQAFPNEGNAYLAEVYLAMKDWDKGFDYGMRAAKNHEGAALTFPSIFRQKAPEMLDDPRTIALLKTIGLPY